MICTNAAFVGAGGRITQYVTCNAPYFDLLPVVRTETVRETVVFRSANYVWMRRLRASTSFNCKQQIGTTCYCADRIVCDCSFLDSKTVFILRLRAWYNISSLVLASRPLLEES